MSVAKRPSATASRGRAIAVGLAMCLAAPAAAQPSVANPAQRAPAPAPTTAPNGDDALAKYFSTLAQMKLIDVEGSTLESLKRDLASGERLLTDGAFTNAAVALYAIVKSPRYAAFSDDVAFQNAQYDLAVALARAGAYGAAMDVIEDVLRRGPGSPYWAPAHRRAVDIALETRDHAGILARLEAIKSDDPIPVSAAGERAYLRGRAAYDAGNLMDAQGELAQVSKTSRLYSSAVYLRGVIWAQKGDLKSSAEAMCEIAGTPDNSKLTFVVDDRYFTIKDLARLGLGRIAHEMGEYDDAYYHYFQIPDDSLYLGDALFEAAWSMYQKRELATSRDLVHEFLRTFPSSPLWPEASLLAGYVELADCKFDDSQKWYDELVARLQPVVNELEQIRTDPELRKRLFDKALTRYREIKGGEHDGQKVGTQKAATPLDDVAALLRLDPQFLRLSEAIAGTHELANTAPAATRQWQNLAAQIGETKVQKLSTTRTDEEEQLADANAALEDLRRLREQVKQQRSELARAARDGTMPKAAAADETKRLDALAAKVATAVEAAQVQADKAAEAVSSHAAGSLRPLVEADITNARRLDRATHALADKLDTAGDQLAQEAVERLYLDVRKVLDKAKLGKIDAIIGQKRKLDIEVQDLAAGRFPEELVGRLWNASMIGDDEEYWPFQGEYWPDEYEGYR